jgi:hypothetical protein
VVLENGVGLDHFERIGPLDMSPPVEQVRIGAVGGVTATGRALRL